MDPDTLGRAQEALSQADALLIGAGAGMGARRVGSAATGAAGGRCPLA